MLVVAGAALRLWQARESLWVDELHTAWCAGGSLAEVAPRAAIGNQSPLYFWLQWLLMRLPGAGEVVLRLPTVVAGSLLPLALYLLIRRWDWSPTAGLVAAALVVVDRDLIFFSTESRPYALVQLLAVIHIGLFAELARRPSTWLRCAFIAVAALLFYLHYTAALLMVAELAFWILGRIIRPSWVHYQWRQLLLDLVLIGLLCLPAIGHLQAIFARRGNWTFVERRPLTDLFELLPWSAAALLILAAVVVELWPLGLSARNDEQRQRRTPFALVASCWLLVPLILTWVTTTTELARLFFPRYLAASAPAALVLAALTSDLAPWRWSKLLVGGLILVAAVWTSGIIAQLARDGRVIADRREDWRSAVGWLNEQLPKYPFPVLVASGYIEADGLRHAHDKLLEDYCVLPVTALYRLHAPRVDLAPLTYHDPGKLTQPAQRLVQSRGGCWLVVRGRKDSAQIASDVAATLEAKGSGFRVQDSGEEGARGIASQRAFGSVEVLLVQRPQQSAPIVEFPNPEP